MDIFRIEAYDISHLDGEYTSGAMAVSENGLVVSKLSRSFTINNFTNDDCSSLKEMITRRLQHKDWQIPNILIVDGGIAQINAVKDILDDDIMLLGMEKSGDHSNSANENILDKNGNIIKLSSYAMNILRLTRDEAHRKANKLRKNRAKNNILKSSLDDINGLGPVNKKKLLLKFGTPSAVLKASYEELIPIVGEKIAKNIVNI